MTRRTFVAETPLQTLLLKQSLLLADQIRQTADAAPDGTVLARVEAVAVRDEKRQVKLLERFRREGLECKALVG